MNIYRCIKSFILCLFCTSFCSGLTVATSSSVIAPHSFFASHKALRQEFLMLSQLLKAVAPAMQKMFITSQEWALKTKKCLPEDVVLQEKFLDALEKDKNIDDETKKLVASFVARTYQASRKKKFTRFHAIAVAGASALALAAAIVVARKARKQASEKRALGRKHKASQQQENWAIYKRYLKEAASLVPQEGPGDLVIAGPERGPLLLEQAITRVKATRPENFVIPSTIQQQMKTTTPPQIDLFKANLKRFLPQDYGFDILWNPYFGRVLSNHIATDELKTFARGAGFARNSDGKLLGPFSMNPFFLIDMYNDLLPYVDLIARQDVKAFGIFCYPQDGGSMKAVCFVQQGNDTYVQVVKSDDTPLNQQEKWAIRTASFFVSDADKCRKMVDFFTSPGVRAYVEYGVYDEILRLLHNEQYNTRYRLTLDQ